MKNTNTYKVEEIGKVFFVIFIFCDGEKMIMSKSYKTEAGANKAMVNIKYCAGVK